MAQFVPKSIGVILETLLLYAGSFTTTAEGLTSFP